MHKRLVKKDYKSETYGKAAAKYDAKRHPDPDVYEEKAHKARRAQYKAVMYYKKMVNKFGDKEVSKLKDIHGATFAKRYSDMLTTRMY